MRGRYWAIVVVAGSFIRCGGRSRDDQDSNCRAINNCGPGVMGYDCPAARNVPNEPGLQVPAMHRGVATASMNAVNGAVQPWHAQMVHVTVTKVELAP